MECTIKGNLHSDDFFKMLHLSLDGSTIRAEVCDGMPGTKQEACHRYLFHMHETTLPVAQDLGFKVLNPNKAFFYFFGMACLVSREECSWQPVHIQLGSVTMQL